MKIIITGAAGFIGFHLTKRLLERDNITLGIDNLNDYYDVNLKKKRLENIKNYAHKNNKSFEISNINLNCKVDVEDTFRKFCPDVVVNLAAQAGVRYSLTNPSAYIQSNLVGFGNILESSKKENVKHLVYASSSSVYGGNKKLPFSERNGVDHPVSLYAASKRANELMAHTYSHLFKLPTTGLRFFTVYGPWGRPDMALFLFTKAILEDKPINVFNYGKMVRDFTYIDDIVESLIRIIDKIPSSNENFDLQNPDPSSSWSPFKIFNIGNSRPTNLMDYINALEIALEKKAVKNFMEIQPGDVTETSADTDLLEKWINFKPNTSIQDGINNFVKWYREYY